MGIAVILPGGGGINKKSFPIFIRFNYKIRLFFQHNLKYVSDMG